MVQISSKNSKPFWGMRLRRVTKIDPFISPTSGDKGLKSTLGIA